jgi:(1->4)-alpha-D-glucan 1-alpha-D-glucosylmutase
MRFQQFTGPVMEKGVEDTALYCFNRLIGMTEVGGDPSHGCFSIAQFHSYCEKMQASHPTTMNTLSTHDTKRSDDVRSRVAVLSEIPSRFSSALHLWHRMNTRFRRKNSSGSEMPDRNTEYFYYQTLIGAWPLSVERAQAYMLKAAREAKQQTSWVANNEEFEAALHGFIENTLADPNFVKKLEAFLENVVDAGRVNSLAQTLLKHTAPGVPDTYQGSELWDLSLVDPDNRRPVDYELRRKLLRELQALSGENIASEIMRRADEGLPKLWTIHQALLLRREKPECFDAGAAYTPLLAEGLRAEHVIAFQRGGSVITVVPRWTAKLGYLFKRTVLKLPGGEWKNRLTGAMFAGGRVEVEDLLSDFPVALLVREGDSNA